MAKSEPIRLETERLQDTICRELDLVDVEWESCWEISFKRGVLASFQNLLKAHEVIKGMTKLAQMSLNLKLNEFLPVFQYQRCRWDFKSGWASSNVMGIIC